MGRALQGAIKPPSTRSRARRIVISTCRKRFAKVDCDAHVGHSGTDIHTELRRGTLLSKYIFRTGKKTAEVYDDMTERKGTGLLYQLTEIPEPDAPLDPNDFAPWSWQE